MLSMATSRFPSICVSGPCDGVVDRDSIPAEASRENCISDRLGVEAEEDEIVGTSQAMTRLRMQIQRIGPHFRTVMVSGEAGTGKRLVARALHRLSPGSAGPFVVCRTSAGSFDASNASASAADIDRFVKTAQGGTLFLDGISEMPMEAQVHLLRVLLRQDGSQAGTIVSQKRDMRVIASTHEDVRVLASAGRFLQELYQRLAMVEIGLSPLRERREDIPLLATYFLTRQELGGKRRIEVIDEDAMRRLEAHSWPGNVRELKSVLQHGVLQCRGTVLDANNLPTLVEGSPMMDAHGTARLQDVVERHVLRVLKSCSGNKLRAAELLGISRSTLYRMLETHSDPDGTTSHSR
jgi:DNA-binding NtrC family response regulator